jgi:hypothetical protein
MFENWDTPPNAGKMEHVAIAIVFWIRVAPLTSLFLWRAAGMEHYTWTLISKITFHIFFETSVSCLLELLGDE